jgi:hypothetical protein
LFSAFVPVMLRREARKNGTCRLSSPLTTVDWWAIIRIEITNENFLWEGDIKIPDAAVYSVCFKAAIGSIPQYWLE